MTRSAVGKEEEVDDPAKINVTDDDDVVFWASVPEFVRAAVRKHKAILENCFCCAKAANPWHLPNEFT